ncbi:MAG: DMT family transporter [Candidatus Bathyarchaeum sp.]|nr:MAG: DMT family transporter [Candidatus Bathyarchaeum sp.]
MFGIALALLSALAFGLSQILVRKNLDKSNFVYISLTVTIIGNIILWPLALYFTNLSTINPEGLLLFIVAGLLAPGIARLFYFKGMETAGISANASIFATYPLYTSIVAILLLGEALTAENWIGLVCVVAGVIFVGRNINNGSTQTKYTSKKGFIVPMLGSFAIAFSQIVRKESLNIYNQPLLGVAVGYTTALIVYLLVMAFSKDSRTTRFSRQDLQMFWKPGVGIAAGWLLCFLALSQEMVSIVVPILQTELLFILFFAYIFLRKLEKFSFKLVASAFLIVAGVILISIN